VVGGQAGVKHVDQHRTLKRLLRPYGGDVESEISKFETAVSRALVLTHRLPASSRGGLGKGSPMMAIDELLDRGHDARSTAR
jgi:hypothetical protein